MFRPYKIISAAAAGSLVGGVLAIVLLFSRGQDAGLVSWLAWIFLGAAAGAVWVALGQGLRNLIFHRREEDTFRP